MFDAMQNDGRLAKRIAEGVDPDRPARPGLVDYDRVAREVHQLTNYVVVLIRQMGGKVPAPAEPMYSTERFRDDNDADNDAKFWSELTASNPTLRGVPNWN